MAGLRPPGSATISTRTDTPQRYLLCDFHDAARLMIGFHIGVVIAFGYISSCEGPLALRSAVEDDSPWYDYGQQPGSILVLGPWECPPAGSIE